MWIDENDGNTIVLIKLEVESGEPKIRIPWVDY